jgi:diketogulonate reductase-like aldo/keto reductase
MHRSNCPTGRRDFLKTLAAVALTPSMGTVGAAGSGPLIRKAIPGTKEFVPIIGMGSWITLDVGNNTALRNDRLALLRTFFQMGGSILDSSPMYGSSQAVIGYCLARLGHTRHLFSATKVWAWSQSRGVEQMEASKRLWGVERFDLMQIHNLLDWQAHLETLLMDKAEGRVRYVGVTTSHGRRHNEMAKIMAEQPLDFVQLTYNILDRRAERYLLPLAAERGQAVIANRPFRGGDLFDHFARNSLPEWAREFDCANWAQFFLKFVVSHPAVTCAIPATSRIDHLQENMGAMHGPLPDQKTRERMIRYIEGL